MPRATFQKTIHVSHLDGVYAVTVKRLSALEFADVIAPLLDETSKGGVAALRASVKILKAVEAEIDCVPNVEELDQHELPVIFRAVLDFFTRSSQVADGTPSTPSSQPSDD